jgi:hypothetical protein
VACAPEGQKHRPKPGRLNSVAHLAFVEIVDCSRNPAPICSNFEIGNEREEIKYTLDTNTSPYTFLICECWQLAFCVADDLQKLGNLLRHGFLGAELSQQTKAGVRHGSI